jgi:hypothetical protein
LLLDEDGQFGHSRCSHYPPMSADVMSPALARDPGVIW